MGRIKEAQSPEASIRQSSFDFVVKKFEDRRIELGFYEVVDNTMGKAPWHEDHDFSIHVSPAQPIFNPILLTEYTKDLLKELPNLLFTKSYYGNRIPGGILSSSEDINYDSFVVPHLELPHETVGARTITTTVDGVKAKKTEPIKRKTTVFVHPDPHLASRISHMIKEALIPERETVQYFLQMGILPLSMIKHYEKGGRILNFFPKNPTTI